MDDWKFSSPTRYIRAINNGEIPITFDYFKDFISDNLTISLRSMPKSKMTDLIKNDSQQLVKLRKGIKKYNHFFRKNKNSILKHIFKLEKKLNNNYKFTLLVLVLNEIDGLKEIVPKIELNLFNNIIFVDGGSTDGSIEWLKENKFKIVEQKKKDLVMLIWRA